MQLAPAPISTTQRDDLAAWAFPKQWAAVANKLGASKKRQQLRRLAEDAAQLMILRQSGACCGNCSAFEREPPSSMPEFGSWCAAESDFHGYVKASAGGLCVRYRAVQQIGEELKV